ncbi:MULTISPECIES: alanine racemase [unclassified Corynebacterium]|uniref:alanine racemase n=1 Tax=unclassified Corynebacterium TaxID=2624378 RepID=UPI001EF68E2D|nr:MULTISPECIES: alanine racemase [unclassified Corynebacterium]MCG7258503.1 alanine racemase [Corynebacterium sp. ACRQK]MCG7263048.1 alanine racemase [Corynebacterium sp. ACRQL]
MSDRHLAELVVDLDAIAHNVRVFREAAAPAGVLAVVKADAYNHGVDVVAPAMLDAGVEQLGVATLGEALHLREILGGLGERYASAPITAWMWTPDEDLTEVIAADINVGVPSLAHARSLVEQAEKAQREAQVSAPVRVTLMVDTGLSRSGVSPAEWQETVELLASNTELVEVTGVMTHMASADAPKSAANDLQAARFAEAIEFCRSRGLQVPRNHIANTPATLHRPDLAYELVRPGVGLYGIDPIGVGVELKAAMTLRARVTTTRVVPKGEGVSYSHTWRAQRDTRTAVVALGYADGLPRSVSGKMLVTINGKTYSQIGRVCMDQIVVELGPADNAADVNPGDWAVIFGQGGTSADEFAELAGTISYEVLTMPRGPRVKRVFKGGRPDFSTDGSCAAATADDMWALGEQLGKQLEAGTVVVLSGPLGAGKTTLTQGLAAGLGVKGRVQSPTFTIVRTHRAGQRGVGLLHMDAYRLLGADVEEGIEPGRYIDRNEVLDALESLDIDADIDNVVVVAEWGRGVVEPLSDKVLDVQIDRSSVGSPADLADSEAPAADADSRTVTWRWV